MSEGGERRARVLLALLIFVMVILTVRLWHLQVVHGERYERLADGNRLRRIPIPAPRGAIYDAQGRPVVSNRLSFTVSLVPDALGQQRAAVIEHLADLLGIDPAVIDDALRNPSSYPYEPVRIVRDVPPERVVVIEENRMNLPGVLIEEEPARHYLYGELASHVIGYMQPISRQELAELSGYRSSDLIGRTGLERAFESWLRGREGSRLVEVNALSRPVRQLGEQPPVPGHDLYLTLDLDLQQIVETAFREQLDVLANDRALATPPKVGAVVVLDPRDGAVLAALSYPSYDPGRFLLPGVQTYYRALEKDARQPMLNRFLSGQYPPGSAFKPVTAVAILESGAIDPDEEYYATGFVTVGRGHVKRNWTVPLGLPAPGWIDVRGALAQSSNDYFWAQSVKAGIEAIAATARAFGLGRPTGIDLLPQERAGLVGDPEWKAASRRHLPAYEQQWYPAETMDVAIGQGALLVTPLQLASVYAILANRGVGYVPYLVKKIVDGQGRTVYEHKPRVGNRVQASRAVWQAIHEGLVAAVHTPKGTAYNVFREFPYPVAGKTGSAQVAQGAAHGWFGAYAPADDPQVVVVVLVEHGGGGARAAAPIARRILEGYFELEQKRAGMAAGAEKQAASLDVSG